VVRRIPRRADFDVAVSTLLLVRLPGGNDRAHRAKPPASVRFVREDGSAAAAATAAGLDAAVRIDRRGTIVDQARPVDFVCYRIGGASRGKAPLARVRAFSHPVSADPDPTYERAAGMSLVGPSSRLLEASSYSEDWTTAIHPSPRRWAQVCSPEGKRASAWRP
jgi:hypothetical protein